MSEQPPSRPETWESANEDGQEITPASTDPVHTPPRTPEEEAKLETVREKLSSGAAKKTTAAGATEKGGHTTHGGAGHGHENFMIKWGVKQPVAIFGYFFSLIFQGIKRWGEMAGKGGGGAKASGGGHGGGHH